MKFFEFAAFGAGNVKLYVIGLLPEVGKDEQKADEQCRRAGQQEFGKPDYFGMMAYCIFFCGEKAGS